MPDHCVCNMGSIDTRAKSPAHTSGASWSSKHIYNSAALFLQEPGLNLGWQICHLGPNGAKDQARLGSEGPARDTGMWRGIILHNMVLMKSQR